MKWYDVGGEYGPQGGDFVSRYIYAGSQERAFDIFERYVKRWYGDLTWDRMGRSNMYLRGN